jgi:23S rRNA A1618 N6-methylase RlmF
MENDMTNIDRFAGWLRTQYNGKAVWVECYEAAAHFHKKEDLVKEMKALRSLELQLAQFQTDPNTLDYILAKMVDVNKKIISSNRKSRSKGWYVVDDERMQQYKKDRAQ